jgi:predicted O-methyltransferase YrrM
MTRLEEILQEPDGAARLNGLLPLVAMCKPKTVLEIGAFEGRSAEVFLLSGANVTSVDPWKDLDEVLAAAVRRLTPYGDRWTMIRGSSPAALVLLRSASYDLVYIDGDHSYNAVRSDIAAARRLVAPGGWLGGHDYGGPGTPEVKPAVDEMLGRPPHLFPDANFLCRM